MNKYPRFKSQKSQLATNTVSEVFSLSQGIEFATVQVRVSNDQPTVGSNTPNLQIFVRDLRIWITNETNISLISNNNIDIFEPKAEIVANGSYSGFGITLGAGERMFMRAGGNGLTVRVSALEHEVTGI